MFFKPGALFRCILQDAGWPCKNGKVVGGYFPVKPDDILMFISHGEHNSALGARYLLNNKIIWLYEQQAKKILRDLKPNDTQA